MSDEIEVIQQVLDGNADAFRILVHRYERPVWVMVANMIADPCHREDIAQDVFLTAYRNLGKFDRTKGQFSTWLLTIARNTCVNALKKRYPMASDNLPEEPDVRTPYHLAAERDFFEELDRRLNSLPVGEKTVFVMAELMEKPFEEIARVENIALGTVRSRLSKAKEKLRALYKKEVHPHE